MRGRAGVAFFGVASAGDQLDVHVQDRHRLLASDIAARSAGTDPARSTHALTWPALPAQAFAGVFVDGGTILTGQPSVVASNWKSTAHTRFDASARRVRRRPRAEAFASPALRHA
jgi:hypothetical protein